MAIGYLLDTHVLLWALIEPDKLSLKVHQLLADPTTKLWVSAASAWEISTKHRLGKLPQAAPILLNYQAYLQRLQVLELSISGSHALWAGQFENNHRDPFDRMLAAQAALENLILVTQDNVFATFPVKTHW